MNNSFLNFIVKLQKDLLYLATLQSRLWIIRTNLEMILGEQFLDQLEDQMEKELGR